MAVYNACVLSTLLYGSETWSTYAKQEHRLNAFHMRCIRRILGISWKDKVTNAEVLSRAGLPTMFTLLRQRRLRWLGHVRRMEDGRIPKDLLYGELILGKRSTGRPQLRLKDVCKGDLKALDINTEHWKDLADDRARWRCTLSRQLNTGEARLMRNADERRIRTVEQTSPEMQDGCPTHPLERGIAIRCNPLPMQLAEKTPGGWAVPRFQ
ncbi:hypothetical protein Bbelb_038330 [Branchiostoma belcheri]|nr:hypothetical protein Bbelb_038330 [Branchiostoma belcheri]